MKYFLPAEKTCVINLPSPPITATIRTIRRDGISCRLITLVLDHNPTLSATLPIHAAY
ncbi:MAG: hypothetical protein JXA21_22000 [Anaerolineae bacterium]|nr:hypothetical protein [Anaerolineae bacterium]